MGDAILCTPALRAIRKHFASSQITFFGSETVRQILSPSNFNNGWLVQTNDNPFENAKVLRKNRFAQVILFKNSFASALAGFLAAIPKRTGYARESRGILLTDRLIPKKTPDGRYKPGSMIDYYLEIAYRLGCSAEDKTLELQTGDEDSKQIYSKYPHLKNPAGPVIVLVPGGTFGPSKCWPAERFALTADRLTSKYNASVFVSVSPAKAEKKIADEICGQSKNKIISLAENPLTISELKFLFSIADLVITNDTGPRHIAIAFKRDVITLFGPNDPAWTQTGWEREIKITGKADCVPCAEKKCKRKQHECMESISVDMVCEAADKLLDRK